MVERGMGAVALFLLTVLSFPSSLAGANGDWGRQAYCISVKLTSQSLCSLACLLGSIGRTWLFSGGIQERQTRNKGKDPYSRLTLPSPPATDPLMRQDIQACELLQCSPQRVAR